MSSALTTRMLVLGVVSIFEPANGYQIRRELLSWQVEQWADLKPGSVYSMLNTLTKQKLLVRHDLPESGRSVAVYGLSDAGRNEFRQLVSLGLDGSRTMDQTTFRAALNFAPFLDRAEAVKALRARVHRLGEWRSEVMGKLAADKQGQVIPPHVSYSLTLDVALVDTEVIWLRDAITMFEAGFLGFAGDEDGWTPPPDDSGWEMVHQSARYREQIAALRR